MNDALYFVCLTIVAVAILSGIFMMSRVRTALWGNRISALGALFAILLTLWREQLLNSKSIWLCLFIGLILGAIAAYRVRMIEMPQFIALLNGLGGAASALIALASWLMLAEKSAFIVVTTFLAMIIGILTLSGSLVAAGKLHKILPQKPLTWPGQNLMVLFILPVLAVVAILTTAGLISDWLSIFLFILLSALLGIVFSIRVGGADMPIAISFLNSLSGVAGAVAGMAIGHSLLVFIGAVVGASGLLLTQIMCRSMNRSLPFILLGKTSQAASFEKADQVWSESLPDQTSDHADDPYEAAVRKLKDAKQVIIVPGYGLALAQVQHLVHAFAQFLEKQGKTVKYAIHPVAGRMPGHMNVLLCEAGVPYEKLYEADAINPEFSSCDVVLVVGANDVINPAANTAKGTPIYGMPVLSVEKARSVIICNYDKKPGYAGVDNPLYEKEGVILLLGDAGKTLEKLLNLLKQRMKI